MSVVHTDSCPNCGLPLVHVQLPAETILCANCQHRFTRAVAGERPTISGKAIASLALGIAAPFVMCLAGVPAIVMGILALRDIRRSQGRARGRGLAVSGIVMGSLFGVVCMPISIVMMLGALQALRHPPREYTNAAQIAALLPKLPDHQPPANLTPIYGFEDPRTNLRQVIYADRAHEPTTLVFLSQGASAQPFMRTVLERQMQGWEQGRQLKLTVYKSETMNWTIADRQVEVARQTGVRQASGVDGSRYVAYLQGHNHSLGVMVCTEDRLSGNRDVTGTLANSRPLTEDEVRDFFASIRFREDPIR